MRDIRKEEVNLEKEIKDYLTQYDEEGIQVNPHTVIYGQATTRKSTVGLKDQEARIKSILEAEGLYDPSIVQSILKSKEGSKVALTKLRVEVTK